MRKFKLVEVNFIDMFHFQLYEGKFQDMEQLEHYGTEVYVYANLSNLETGKFNESEVRVYAHPFDTLYSALYYELFGFDYETMEQFYWDILKYINDNN